jgi:hypothetical protein
MFIRRIRARLGAAQDRISRGETGETRASPVAEPPCPAAMAHTSRWPAARIAMAERLWGVGFLAPGGAEAVARLAGPLRLCGETRCLLVGEMLSGPAHALEGSGAPVSMFVDDPLLAARAGAREWTALGPDFGVARYDRALALEPFTAAGADRSGMVLDALARAVAPIGQLMLTALVTMEGAEAGEGAETGPLVLPTEAPVTLALRRHGFGLRSVTDLSAAHMELVRADWSAAMAALPRARLPEEEARALLAEEARWRARLALLSGGQARLLCWHAVGKAFTALDSAEAGLTGRGLAPR